jgi:hypothetical protein
MSVENMVNILISDAKGASICFQPKSSGQSLKIRGV